uniref:Uncharacterized protein n=1 Tax=Arundo donax TaxID=35708 RepID=A0A0A9FBU5_ARUDO
MLAKHGNPTLIVSTARSGRRRRASSETQRRIISF